MGRRNGVVVVGAGLAGLSATLHLLGAGFDVTLLEREAGPGGRVSHQDGFDTGATVLTMPELVDEAFAAVGVANPLRLRRLDPAYRAHFADGSTIDVRTGAEAMEAEIRAFAGPREAAGYRNLRKWLTELYAVEKDHFIGANFDSPLGLLRPELLRLAALGGFDRLDRRIGRFLTDARLRRLFSFQALYAGLDPRRALGAYGVIPYMDTIAGVYYPDGGMGRLPQALADAAEQAGAQLKFGTEAAWLERVSSRVMAVRTRAGERLACDAVVLATELATAYRLLGKRPRRPFPLRYSPSAVVLHGKAARAWPALAHHTIFFGHAWEETFTEIIRKGSLMSDPSLLVTRPPGGSAVSVLAPAPNLHAGAIDWARIGPAYTGELLRTLAARGLTGFDREFAVTELVTPQDWAARGLAAGTPFSLAHTFGQTGPFRPRNVVRGIENVALAGCGTIPGVGIPPVLISGRLAAARIAGSATTPLCQPAATTVTTTRAAARPRYRGGGAPSPRT
ncbi:phytoene desaturase family protein [Amycolatopsis taiwanensis]|uniref:Phytoene dehydrogenase n=1 Tax=Amycolatopsis taiwanensis TaxID=342230 RepID=A0A9W6R0S7_9PSEU|nr:phytoene desaturase family protein [Amycolatopsis taiwanensis]GLY66253.1 phytoene dehydrogenase [Amycolatopsis taiwanensis]